MVCGELSAAVACASRSNRRSISLRLALAAGAEQLRAHQLDGGGARQQPMLGAPHLAHAAVPEQFDQLVAAQLLRLAQLAPDAVQKPRRHNRRRSGQA